MRNLLSVTLKSERLTCSSRPAIVIPARNESFTVGEVVSETKAICDYPVYVIDDASNDQTNARAKAAGAVVIPLVDQIGAWCATQAGLRYALKQGHDVVITMDADGQHDPRCIPHLIAALRETEADVCIGSWPDRGSNLRKIAWNLLRATSGIKLDDLTSGFRAYNKEALTILTGWRATFLEYQDVGVLALLERSDIKLVDVRTKMRNRAHGSSRVFRSWLVVFSYMCHTVLLGLTKRSVHRTRRRAALVRTKK